MKKKTVGLLLALMTAVSVTACGTKNIANEAVAMESNVIVTEETGLIVEDASVELETEESLTKIYGNFVIYNEAQGEAVYIPLKDFYFLEGEYLLTSDVPIYYTGGKTAGYAKEGTTITVMDGNTEWLRFKNTTKKDYFTVDFLLVKADELRNATNVEVVTTQKIDEPETEPELLASVETQEKTPEQETSKVEKPKTETTVPATTEPVVVEPDAAEPVVVEPETPIADNTKYTPEEAIAVYRSIMEANGISWNPSLKNGGSWGTGWFYLKKGWIDENAYQNVEVFKMGGGDSTRPWRSFYMEITDSDENAVYFTQWHA